MTALLLVHGGFLDRHCWDLSLPFLKDQGFVPHTVSMPGNGRDTISAFSATMAKNAKAICDKVEEIGGPVVLLGHSMGGYSISAAAEMCPGPISQMIYLSGWLPEQAGMSMLQMDKNHADVIKGPLVEPAVNWKLLRGVLQANPETCSQFLCHTATDEGIAFLRSNLHPQPIRPGLSKVAWSEARMGAIPKAYIECAEDRAIPLGGQKHFQKNATFERVVTINSDHCPFISEPEMFAKAVAEAVTSR